MKAVHVRRSSSKVLLTLTLAGFAPQVLAHAATGAAGVSLADALLHPFTGADHLAFLLGAGLWSAQQNGRARYFPPLGVLLAMASAALCAAAGVSWPLAETAIAVSLVALGGALLGGRGVPSGLATVLVSLCALGHGYAHGSALLAGAGALPYVTALLGSSAAIIGVGFGLGWRVRRAGHSGTPRLIGVALAAAGGLLLSA